MHGGNHPTFDQAIAEAGAAGNQALAARLGAERDAFEALVELYGKVNNPDLGPIIQDDLRISGGSPYPYLRPGLLMVYDIAVGLRDSRAAKGNPVFVRVLESTPDIGGQANSVGYVVPPGREARIDAMSLSFVPALPVGNFMWTRGDFILQPSGAGADILKREQLANGLSRGEGLLSMNLESRIYLNQQDFVASQMTQTVYDPATTSYTSFIAIFGVEVDAGYGFKDFP